MPINMEGLTPGEIWIVEWQYRMMGGFNLALLNAIARADSNNIEKLRLGFPDEVGAYEAYTQQDGWWEELQKKIGMEGT
jgi:hypothetical protein